MKEIINKRIINDNIYNLLKSRKIDQIVRHFKIIKNKNYNLNSKNIYNHQINENCFIADYDNASNDHLDELIYFNDFYESSNDILEIINNANDNAIENFVIDINEKTFNDEELSKLKIVLLKYINNISDKLYIRLGIKPEDKNDFVKKLYELYISEYYNELTEEAQNRLKNNELLPMLNDTIFYSGGKYNYLNNEFVSTIINIDNNELMKNIEEL